MRSLTKSIPSISNFTLMMAIGSIYLSAQSEADRPAGEVTKSMLDRGEVVENPPVIPTPQETYWGTKTFQIGDRKSFWFSIEMVGRAKGLDLIEEDFVRRVKDKFGVVNKAGKKALKFVFALDARALPTANETVAQKLKTLESDEGYVIISTHADDQQYVLIAGKSDRGLWHGMATVYQLIYQKENQLFFPEIDIVDYPKMAERALFPDIGGQGFMVGPSRWNYDQWKELVDWMVDHKMNELWLEFIGSGRLMGNLDVDNGEWVGWPLELESYPNLIAKDRPIRRWDESKEKMVEDTYTAPNIRDEFVRELIDYAQERGIECTLVIGYDYFANMMPSELGLPANDPSNLEANKVYDKKFTEIVKRYSNASAVIMITIENKNVPPEMLDHVIRRTWEGYNIVKSINPAMEVGTLCDYLEWKSEDDLVRLKEEAPEDVFFAYTPHRQPQQKSWKRIWGDAYRYCLYSQYAWDHVAYVFPEQIRHEMQVSYIDGYRSAVSQTWYWDVFSLNFMALAEYSWSPNAGTIDEFWNKALGRTFEADAREHMRNALEHTRFDIRFDIIARMILRDDPRREFSFWDMYVMTLKPHGVTKEMLEELEYDAKTSLAYAQKAFPLVEATPGIGNPKKMVEVTIISAERRFYLATSATHMLRALELRDEGKKSQALEEIDLAIKDGEKLQVAARKLGIEYPLAMHDDQVLAKYREIKAGIKGG